MSVQSILAFSAVGFAALYFIRGAVQDLSAPKGAACGKCSSGGCPAARKG
ncbi:MAG: hypothetical protein HY014_08050 [Acidobacteria bacterium]|nr:hypothetical protein [Acidobacteriota bacterium]MBI3488103.1 hypothetical protein [Acidobacteriota bacterium]